MANLLCASPTFFEGEAVVISDDGNWTYISPTGLTAQWPAKVP
jgi:hypothetical protein